MKVAIPEVIEPAENLGRVHFVGIGGAGLSAIARLMLARGITVSGSDGSDSPVLTDLAAEGATVHVGHTAEQVAEADTLVVSTAVPETNPEVVEALRRGLRVLPRSAALASVMLGRRTLAVAGTHGKTTTTSLLTSALMAAGAEPSYAIGGRLAATGTNAQAGASDLLVAEADESDGAFLVYRPHAAIVTNIDADHLDQWGTPEAYAQGFTDFLARIEPDGFLVTWADSPATLSLAEQARALGLRVITYGLSPEADLGADALTEPLQVPGQHYVLNALAALAMGRELGFDDADLVRGLAGYTGTERRMEFKGEVDGVRVYDSYAHHPSEIRGDLQAARELAGQGRILVAYQPHLVSRTRIFGAEMGEALGAADDVTVLEVYLAREAADPAVNGALVADAVPLAPEAVRFEPDFDAVPAHLATRARPGDLLLTLGAGTVTQLAPRIVELLRGSEDA